MFLLQLTCAMVGKGQRIATYTQSQEYLAKKGSMLKSYSSSGQFQVSERCRRDIPTNEVG